MARGADKGGDEKIPSDDRRVSGYLGQLEGYLEQCARDVEARPDAFLWNARRSIEAMARVIHVRGAVPTPIDTTLDKLLEALEKKLIPTGDRNAFRSVQDEGNFGAHVQGPEPPAYERPVERCRSSLRDAVTWFYEQPGMPPVPDRVNRALAVLDGRARSPLTVEHEAAAKKTRDLETALASAQRELAVAKREVEAAQRDNTRLRRELDLEHARRSPARPASETTAGAPAAALRAPVLVGAVLGVLLLLGTAAALRGHLLDPSSATASAAPPPAPSSSTTVGAGSAVATAGATATEGIGAPDAAAPDPASAAPSVATASAAPLESCPDDMIAFARGVAEFGEPYPRTSWFKTSPRKSGLHATVAPFCLDQHPVRAVASWVGRRAHEGDRGFGASGCNPATARSGSPVNCVMHTEAETWCKERGARLPSLVEWELVASRGADKKLELPGKTDEWVADPFPSPAWDRGPPQECDRAPCFLAREERISSSPPGRARFSWMRHPASTWLGNLTFRCALDRR